MRTLTRTGGPSTDIWAFWALTFYLLTSASPLLILHSTQQRLEDYEDKREALWSHLPGMLQFLLVGRSRYVESLQSTTWSSVHCGFVGGLSGQAFPLFPPPPVMRLVHPGSSTFCPVGVGTKKSATRDTWILLSRRHQCKRHQLSWNNHEGGNVSIEPTTLPSLLVFRAISLFINSLIW